MLLQGPDARRVVSLKAETDVLLRVCNRELFDWFLRDRPHAVVAFVLTTTCRQWRVAYTTLVDTLGTECRQPLSPCSISLLHLPSPSPFSISLLHLLAHLLARLPSPCSTPVSMSMSIVHRPYPFSISIQSPPATLLFFSRPVDSASESGSLLVFCHVCRHARGMAYVLWSLCTCL